MLNFYLRAISNILGYSLVAAGYSSAPVKANIVASTVNIISSLVLIRIFGYIGAVYSLLLMNITSQIIYGLLLNQVGLAPHLLEYLKPVFLFVVAVSTYWFFGADSYLVGLLLIGLYIGACWMLIKEVRESSNSVWKYIFKLRVHSESA
jgi:O-antigen/teichoic acid export membrane protein